MERIRMDRVNAILKHKTYRKYYDQIEKIEKDRIFCRHQMPHLLDVARTRLYHESGAESGV